MYTPVVSKIHHTNIYGDKNLNQLLDTTNYIYNINYRKTAVIKHLKTRHTSLYIT